MELTPGRFPLHLGLIHPACARATLDGFREFFQQMPGTFCHQFNPILTYIPHPAGQTEYYSNLLDKGAETYTLDMPNHLDMDARQIVSAGFCHLLAPSLYFNMKGLNLAA
jgi:hypothetical protein